MCNFVETKQTMTNYDNAITDRLSKIFSDISYKYNAEKERIMKRREQGEFFNVFNIVGLKTEEVRLHSALLAELLYPKGSHGASSLFLKAFLNVINEDDEYINCNRCSADIKERYIGVKTKTDGGRIDIIIEDGNHAIIIENKINAPDQENQLLRYYNYGRKRFPNGFKLLYLTLNGSEPNDCSLGNKKFDFQTISYNNEIISWLEQCSELARDKKNAQIIINQYCDLVKELTVKDMDKKYIEQLKEITLAPENVAAVGEILKIQEEWLAAIQERHIWQPLRDYATSKDLEYGEDDDSFWIYKPEWLHYALFIDYDRGWYVGVSWYNEPNRKNKLHKKEFNKLDCLKESSESDWPYGWEYLSILDWGYEHIDKIVEGEVFKEINNKFEEILAEIEQRNLRMP